MPSPGRSDHAVSLVVPCYNEEACIGHTAREILTVFGNRNIPLQLVLVDNGSKDRTGEIIDSLVAEGHPVTKVTVPVNQGYGYGVLQGLAHCTAPLVGFLCADGQVSPEDTLIAYDMSMATRRRVLVKVRRRWRKDSWRRKVVSVIYNFLMQFVFGWLGSLDLNGNPKLLRRPDLQAMDLQSKDWFLDPEIMIKAKHMGVKVLEVDVECLERFAGTSNVRYSTCFEFLTNIFQFRFSRHLSGWKSRWQDEQVKRANHSVGG